MILAIIYKLPQYFLPSFNWPFGSGDQGQNRISRWPPWWPSWISDQNNFSYFLICKSHWYFLPSFESIRLSVQEKKQNRFTRWPPWQSSSISDRNNFYYFWSASCLNTSYQVSIGLSVQETKGKIEFQDGCLGSHLGFPIGTILAIFDLILPTKFLSQFTFRFRRWSAKYIFKMAMMAAIYDFWSNNFSYFWSASCLDTSYQISSQLAFRFKRRSAKQISKMVVILDFWSEWF